MSLIEHYKITNVRLLSGKLELKQITMIHSCCNAFILPTRAEGWGLPIIEAIASGSPEITNFHSGQTEYNHSVSDKVELLDFSINQIKREELISNAKYGAEWAI